MMSNRASASKKNHPKPQTKLPPSVPGAVAKGINTHCSPRRMFSLHFRPLRSGERLGVGLHLADGHSLMRSVP